MLLHFIHNEENFCLEVKEDSSFGELKKLVSKRINIPQNKFDLMIDEDPLDGDHILQETEVTTESIIRVVEKYDRKEHLIKEMESRGFGRRYYRNFAEGICHSISDSSDEEFVDMVIELIGLINDKEYNLEYLLCIASYDGDLSLVKRLLSMGVDPAVNIYINNDDYYKGATSLVWAVLPCCVEIVRELLAFGSTEFDYHLALDLAIQVHNEEIIDAIMPHIKNLEEYDSNVLNCTIKNGNLELFKRLLDKGADPVRSDRYSGYNTIGYMMYDESMEECDLREYHLALFERGYLFEFIKELTNLNSDQIKKYLKD